MKSQPPVAEPADDSRQERDAWQVLDMLDRWSDRLDGHMSHQRSHHRNRFRVRVLVYVVSQDDWIAGEATGKQFLRVWARNLSQSGLNFIYPNSIGSEKLVICLDPDHGGKHWYQGQIVRRRMVHNGFWEYGVKLTGIALV